MLYFKAKALDPWAKDVGGHGGWGVPTQRGELDRMPRKDRDGGATASMLR